MDDERVKTSSLVWSLVGFVATIGLSLGAYTVGQRMSGVSGEALAGGAAEGQATQVSVNGGELFALSCAGCHGAKAEGGVGPNLAVTKSWALPVFSEAVLHGQAEGRTLSSIMPHFADTGLSGEPATPAQIEAIHNFIKSL
ncbi:hypothetical protein GCM10022631_01300 [Deinococcus rubellus]|uniref:Cytochrome c n=1 Tax=Deinococcus rubellus TaxID=1889240 RepID=A0ABY5YK99_9DEIO|nr:cytochrome c [Deinococcus rubellus]UWX65535.1 cytochrome c [Deinococcus rubellus]